MNKSDSKLPVDSRDSSSGGRNTACKLCKMKTESGRLFCSHCWQVKRNWNNNQWQNRKAYEERNGNYHLGSGFKQFKSFFDDPTDPDMGAQYCEYPTYEYKHRDQNNFYFPGSDDQFEEKKGKVVEQLFKNKEQDTSSNNIIGLPEKLQQKSKSKNKAKSAKKVIFKEVEVPYPEDEKEREKQAESLIKTEEQDKKDQQDWKDYEDEEEEVEEEEQKQEPKVQQPNISMVKPPNMTPELEMMWNSIQTQMVLFNQMLAKMAKQPKQEEERQLRKQKPRNPKEVHERTEEMKKEAEKNRREQESDVEDNRTKPKKIRKEKPHTMIWPPKQENKNIDLDPQKQNPYLHKGNKIELKDVEVEKHYVGEKKRSGKSRGKKNYKETNKFTEVRYKKGEKSKSRGKSKVDKINNWSKSPKEKTYVCSTSKTWFGEYLDLRCPEWTHDKFRDLAEFEDWHGPLYKNSREYNCCLIITQTWAQYWTTLSDFKKEVKNAERYLPIGKQYDRTKDKKEAQKRRRWLESMYQAKSLDPEIPGLTNNKLKQLMAEGDRLKKQGKQTARNLKFLIFQYNVKHKFYTDPYKYGKEVNLYDDRLGYLHKFFPISIEEIKQKQPDIFGERIHIEMIPNETDCARWLKLKNKVISTHRIVNPLFYAFYYFLKERAKANRMKKMVYSGIPKEGIVDDFCRIVKADNQFPKLDNDRLQILASCASCGLVKEVDGLTPEQVVIRVTGYYNKVIFRVSPDEYSRKYLVSKGFEPMAKRQFKFLQIERIPEKQLSIKPQTRQMEVQVKEDQPHIKLQTSLDQDKDGSSNQIQDCQPEEPLSNSSDDITSQTNEPNFYVEKTVCPLRREEISGELDYMLKHPDEEQRARKEKAKDIQAIKAKYEKLKAEVDEDPSLTKLEKENKKIAFDADCATEEDNCIRPLLDKWYMESPQYKKIKELEDKKKADEAAAREARRLEFKKQQELKRQREEAEEAEFQESLRQDWNKAIVAELRENLNKIEAAKTNDIYFVRKKCDPRYPKMPGEEAVYYIAKGVEFEPQHNWVIYKKVPAGVYQRVPLDGAETRFATKELDYSKFKKPVDLALFKQYDVESYIPKDLSILGIKQDSEDEDKVGPIPKKVGPIKKIDKSIILKPHSILKNRTRSPSAQTTKIGKYASVLLGIKGEKAQEIEERSENRQKTVIKAMNQLNQKFLNPNQSKALVKNVNLVTTVNPRLESLKKEEEEKKQTKKKAKSPKQSKRMQQEIDISERLNTTIDPYLGLSMRDKAKKEQMLANVGRANKGKFNIGSKAGKKK